MSSISRMSAFPLFINPISFISFSAFQGLSLIKYMGDSFAVSVAAIPQISAGITRQKILVICQSWKRKQKRVERRAPAMKAICTRAATFCLKLSLMHSAPRVKYKAQTASEPEPQMTKPREAIHRSWANIKIKLPMIVSILPINIAFLLPILSANAPITIPPIAVPRKGAVEQRFKQISSSQQQVDSKELARDRNRLDSSVTYLLHWSGGRLHTVLQQSSVSNPKEGQSNCGLLNMKASLMRSTPVTKQEMAWTATKIYWYLPLPPTFQMRSRQVYGLFYYEDSIILITY